MESLKTPSNNKAKRGDMRLILIL